LPFRTLRGGGDGRQIKVVDGDDQGTSAGALAAGQTLASQDGALAVATVSTVAYGAARYFTENNVPVVGSPIDSDEWRSAPALLRRLRLRTAVA
jgi:ABC-type branched-subunit amino acid transport system substrate-binding protein